MIYLFLFFQASAELTEIDEVIPPRQEAAPDFYPENIGVPLYKSCSDVPTRGRPVSPEGHKIANREKIEFYKKLHSLVEQRAGENLGQTLDLFECFKFSISPEKVPTDLNTESYCSDIRHWVNPDKYNSAKKPPIARSESLQSGIELARQHLALAPTGRSVRALTTLNQKLDPLGKKDGTWTSLGDEEKVSALAKLNKYKKNIFLEYGNKSTPNADTYFSQMISSDGPQGRKNRRSPQPFRKGDVNASIKRMKELRGNHYRDYQKIVADLPLINFLSSEVPSDFEIFKAAVKMRPLSEAEWRRLSKYKNPLKRLEDANEKRPKTRINFHEMRSLLDYQGLVEEVLADNNHLCSVANVQTRVRQSTRRFRSYTAMGPLLAASIVFGPLGGALLGAAVGGGFVINALIDEKDTHQAAYSSPSNKNKSLRRTQVDRDRAADDVKTEAVLAVADVFSGGTGSGGWRLIRSRWKLKNKEVAPPSK